MIWKGFGMFPYTWTNSEMNLNIDPNELIYMGLDLYQDYQYTLGGSSLAKSRTSKSIKPNIFMNIIWFLIFLYRQIRPKTFLIKIFRKRRSPWFSVQDKPLSFRTLPEGAARCQYIDHSLANILLSQQENRLLQPLIFIPIKMMSDPKWFLDWVISLLNIYTLNSMKILAIRFLKIPVHAGDWGKVPPVLRTLTIGYAMR